MLHRGLRAALVIAGLIVIGGTSSCSWVSGWFGDDDAVETTAVSVFDAQVGDCFIAPPKVKAEMADLQSVECDQPHQQELYAMVDYTAPAETKQSDTYPGQSALDTFAQGACAEAFSGYVGIAYPDSGLWMTYLLPSARSWQQGKDRAVMCFVTTTGDVLTQSVKGSKL